MKNTVWDEFKEEYSKKLKLSFETLDFIADRQILEAYLHGLSNKDIADEFGYLEEDVSDTIFEWFGEKGRKWTIMYNILDIYYSSNDIYEFKYLTHTTDEDAAKLYAYCTLFRLAEKQMKEEYDGQ